MAIVRWRGGIAVARADQWSLTLSGTWTAGDTITLSVPDASTGVSITLTLGSTVTTTQIAAELATAWNDATAALGTGYSVTERGANIPQMAEYTAVASGSTVVFTADVKGVPGTIAASRVTASSGAVSMSNTVAATGPNFANNALNWSGGTLPADTDVAWVENTDVPILYGLDQSAIELAALYIPMSFTGTIGLPDQNPNGYPEYRQTYWQIGPAVLEVGDGAGTGSGRIRIDSTADVCALTVLNTGSPLDPDLPALLWKGTNASNTLAQVGGSVGVAVFGGETATLATVATTGGSLVTGSGVTLSGALVAAGGSWDINSLVDGSLTVNGATVTIDGTGAVDQLTMTGGSVTYNTSGTLGGSTVLSGPSTLDFGGNQRATTVSNPIDIQGNEAVLLDPFKRLGAVVVDLNGGATIAQLNLGNNFRISRGNVA